MKYVIVDIDGTISKVGDRLKYLQQEPKDWDSFYDHCDEDEPIDEILDLIDVLAHSTSHKIILCTGRRESCKTRTFKWLFKQNIKYFIPIIMRKDGDHRHDTEVKPELLDEYMKDQNITKDDIAFILEDRNSMVKKWRELGYTCLQVADGDF